MSYRRALTLVVIVALSVLTELLVLSPGHAGGGELPSYYFRGLFALLGVVAAALIVLVAKVVARYWLEREEGHYE